MLVPRESAPPPDTAAVEPRDWPRPAAAPKHRPTRAPRQGAKPEADEGENRPAVTPDRIAAFLAAHGTNGENLVAAFLASTNLDYLRMAATNFPNNPLVAHAVILHDAFPGEKREWLDRFKLNAPENSLAGYLSALDYFRTGNRDLALEELTAAGSRPHFEDYAVQKFEKLTDLYRGDDGSPLLSRTEALGNLDLLPGLPMMKELANQLIELRKESAAAGDGPRADLLASATLQLSRHLSTGEGSTFLISQLVGYALENRTLSQLEPDEHYDFLSETPAQRQAQLKAERAGLMQLSQNATTKLLQQPEEVIDAYFRYLKKQGEKAALEWLRDQPEK